MKILIGILLLGTLAGCSTPLTTIISYSDKDGKWVEKVKVAQDAPGVVSYKPETKEVSVDTKQVKELNFWQRNVLPAITGVVDTTSRGR